MVSRLRRRSMAHLLGVLTLSATVVTGDPHARRTPSAKHALADIPLLVVIEAADTTHQLWDELHRGGVCAPADRCRRVKVPSMAAEVGRDATSVLYQLDGEALAKFYATEYDRPTTVGLVTDLARVVGHLRALNVVAQGEGHGYGVVLEEGRVDVGRGAGWACYNADRLSDIVADVQRRDPEWRIVQLAYDMDRTQLVGELMSLRVNGSRSIRRRHCGAHSYIGGTGAYAITPTAAVQVYKAVNVPQTDGSEGKRREQFDLRAVVDGTPDALLYPRSHVHMSTCPTFPPQPLDSREATALLTTVQRKMLLHSKEGKDWSGHFPPPPGVRSVRSEYLFVANHLDKREKTLGCWLPIEQGELSSSVARLLCRRPSHGAPTQACVDYAQARVRAFLDLCANGCQDEEEADPRLYDSGLIFHDGRFVRVDWQPTQARPTLSHFLTSLRPLSPPSSSSSGEAVAETVGETALLREAWRIDRLEHRALSRTLDTLPLHCAPCSGYEEDRSRAPSSDREEEEGRGRFSNNENPSSDNDKEGNEPTPSDNYTGNGNGNGKGKEGRGPRLEVFYLVGCEGHYWTDIVQEQLGEVRATSGFLQAVNRVHIIAQGSQPFSLLPGPLGRNGSISDSDSSLKFQGGEEWGEEKRGREERGKEGEWGEEERGKFRVTHLGREGWDQFEFPALTRLWDFCTSTEGEGSYVLYMHSKGAQSASGGLNALQVATDWRQLMSYFTVRRFRECVALLQAGSYNSCGAQLVLRQNAPHYSGNFWWATCDYVRTLPDPRSLDWTDRLEAEMWLGRGQGWRPANCYRSSVYYRQHYGRQEYEDHMGCGWLLPLPPPLTQPQEGQTVA